MTSVSNVRPEDFARARYVLRTTTRSPCAMNSWRSYAIGSSTVENISKTRATASRPRQGPECGMSLTAGQFHSMSGASISSRPARSPRSKAAYAAFTSSTFSDSLMAIPPGEPKRISVSPCLVGLGAGVVLHPGRRRIRVGVDRVVPNPDAVLVDESHRLLEERGRGRRRGHRRFEDVETVLVHQQLRERARLVRVGELDAAGLDAVRVPVGEVGDLRVLLEEIPRRVIHGTPQFGDVRVVALVGVERAALDAVGVHLLHARVVDDRDRVAVPAALHGVNMTRDVEVVFGVPGDVPDRGLCGEIDREQIRFADVFDPFLRD